MKLVGVAVAALALAEFSLAAELPRRVQSEKVEIVKLDPGGTIHMLNSSGDLIVEGWDRDEVEVAVVRWIDHEFETSKIAQAMERLNTARVTVERPSTREIRVSTIAGHRVEVKYHIFAPRDSRLVLDHRRGYILLNGMRGDIDVANRRGDVVLMLPIGSAYSIDARNKFGIVTPDLPGSIKHLHVVGEKFESGHAEHHIRLRMGFGGITIKEIPPEADFYGSDGLRNR